MARQAMTKKLMVVGIDGMDARITKHLMDEGKMPNLENLLIVALHAKTYTS